jgi:hypothetical protein
VLSSGNSPANASAGISERHFPPRRNARTRSRNNNDGLRSLLLEKSGYSTKLFEFVSTEHTPKNNMLVGTKQRKTIDAEKISEQIRAIKEFYGIKQQRLENLLT